MPIDLSTVRAGDRVILRDGSKITVRGLRDGPYVFMTPLSAWKSDGRWSPQGNPDAGFNIVGVIYGPRKTPEVKGDAND